MNIFLIFVRVLGHGDVRHPPACQQPISNVLTSQGRNQSNLSEWTIVPFKIAFSYKHIRSAYREK